MMYNTIIFLWSSFAVLIFTRTVAFPTNMNKLLNLQPYYTRTVWLHSTNSQGYVQVKGSHVDGHRNNNDESATKMQMESTVFRGSVVIRLKSVKENSYLCVNSEGNLTAEVNGNTMERCLFKEGFYSGYTTFQSMYNTSWFLGFKRNGKVKPPHNTTVSQKAARFLPKKKFRI